MICKAVYETEAEIPSGLRDEFESRDGKYYLKDSAIQEGELIFASGAVANKERALTQLKSKKEEVENANNKIKDLEAELSKAKDPNGVVLSNDEAKAYKEYQALGAVKDVKKIVGEYPQLKEQLSNIQETEGLQKFAEATKLNLEVLKDWKFDKTKGDGIEFFVKDDIQKVNNVDTKVSAPMARVRETKPGTNEVQITEHSLLDIAKQKLSAYQFEALTKASPDVKTTETKPNNAPYIPDGSSTSSTTGDSKDKKPVDKFNQERASKPSPFDPPVAATA